MKSHRLVCGLLTIGLLSGAFFAVGCGADGESEGIVCTTGMVADIVKNVGGSHVKVRALMGPGVDPHTYKVTTDDQRALDNAELILYSGLHLEAAKMTEVLQAINRNDRPSVAVTRNLDHSKLIRAGDEIDPHVWHDPTLWSKCAEVVKDELAKRYPDHKAEFEANLKNYQAKLAKLDEEAKKQIGSLPPAKGLSKPVLVTAHDAFSYFAKRYGLEVKAIQGTSTADGFNVADVQGVTDYIIKHNVKAIFAETSVRGGIPKLLENCRKQNHPVKPGGELYSDALGPPGSGADTYEGMIRHNVNTIANALK